MNDTGSEEAMRQRCTVLEELLNTTNRLTRCCVVALVGVLIASVAAGADLAGTVKVDGSSTVAPITTAAAEMFQAKQPKVRVTVGVSGTGGGFKKFLDHDARLRTDISDASRPIEAAELAKAAELGVQFIEVPIGIDGLAVMVHPSNKFCDYLTVAELKKIWEPASPINNWREVRAGFPDLPLKLFGPGTDSGTFDYFTAVIVGKEKSSRSEYNASENDNTLVQGIAGDPGALGYFGYSYYEANKAKLKLLAVDNGDGKPVKPNFEVIRSGAYKPLSRPLFLYVNAESYKRAEVKAFLEFYLDNARSIVEHPRVNYVAFSEEVYQLGKKRLSDGKNGSVMAGAPPGATDMAELLKSH
jgi:phosphate transport system substrate-binding protein